MISRRHYCACMGERQMPECIIHLKFILVYACARCSNFYQENVSGQKGSSNSGKLLGSWNLWEPVELPGCHYWLLMRKSSLGLLRLLIGVSQLEWQSAGHNFFFPSCLMSATDLKVGCSLLLWAFTTSFTKPSQRDHSITMRLQHTIYLMMHQYA